jgi:hypothetical protein
MSVIPQLCAVFIPPLLALATLSNMALTGSFMRLTTKVAKDNRGGVNTAHNCGM